MRRILTITLVVLLTLSSVSVSFAANPYSSQGEFLRGLDILTGNTSGDLMLNDNLTREQMVVLISRLYGKEDEANKFTADNFFKDITPRESFYRPYILWARDQGLIQGMSESRFGIREDVSVQQFQTVLLRALGYVEEAKDYNSVPRLASEIGIMKNLNFSAGLKPNRGQVSALIVNALNIKLKGEDVTLSGKLGLNPLNMTEVATVSNNTVTFTGKASNVDKLNLVIKPVSAIQGDSLEFEIDLENDGSFELLVDDFKQGKYEYQYISGNKSTTARTIEISNVIFKLSEVKSENLKEIRLAFSKAIDANLASYPFNYSTTAGSVNDVYFENGNKTIVLVLDGVMTLDKEYEVSANNIRSTANESVQVVDEKFIASDDEAPEVSRIEILGTKGLKVYFSEPIKTLATTSNFTLESSLGASIAIGNPVLSYDSITLNYSSPITAGSYTLGVSALEDYAGNLITTTIKSFTVSSDKSAPVINNVSGTTDRITIVFNESIDPVSGVKDNVYWKLGAAKRTADKVTVDGNKVVADFISHPLSTSEVRLYIEGFTDYSGNKMTTQINSVRPQSDLRQPEVLHTKVSQDGKSILVTYNKNVIGNLAQNYTISDSSGRIAAIRNITGSGNEYTVNLNSVLPAGMTNVSISGVADSLGRQIQPYSTSFLMKDLEQPTLNNYSGFGNTIIMEFSKPMDLESLNQLNNYIMTFNNHESFLVSGTQIVPSNNNRNVTITLPLNIDGKETMIGQEGNLTALNIRGLKDSNGNFTNPLVLDLEFDTTSTGNGIVVDYYKNIKGKQAILVDANTMKIKFNLPIVKASKSDFVVAGRDIVEAIADKTNIVTLRLAPTGYNSTTVADNTTLIPNTNKIQTAIGTKVDFGLFSVLDEAPPMLVSTQIYPSGNNLEIRFSEELEQAGDSLYRRDLQIIRLSDKKVLGTDDYTTSLKINDKSTIVINIKDRSVVSKYSIRVIDNPINIKDKVGNLVVPSQTIETIVTH